jgi:hypothetical protein
VVQSLLPVRTPAFGVWLVWLVLAAAGCGGGPGTTASSDVCTFQIQARPSSAIPTVGVVDWSTDLAGLSGARIEVSLTDPKPAEINRGSGGPIDVTGATHRALMLGLKAQRRYSYRIVATDGAVVCTSPDRTLTTGAAVGAPSVTRTAANAALQAPGFIIATAGVPGLIAISPAAPDTVYVVDADGDLVWWADAPHQTSRALMSWDGSAMWMLAANPADTSAAGELRRVDMDGMNAETVAGFSLGHHDLAVLPDGAVAALVHTGDVTATSDLVERAPDGTISTVVRLDDRIYRPGQSSGQDRFHANTVRYHLADDSYTVGDRDGRLIVKLTRQGRLLWQIAADCTGAPAPKCASGLGGVTHGHHLLDDGRLVAFHNGDATTSTAREYALTETATSLAIEATWSYAATGLASNVLGDVQRLPNGNTLVTYSTDGVIHEVSPTGDLVQALAARTFGYTNFRETLYGPPLPY